MDTIFHEVQRGACESSEVEPQAAGGLFAGVGVGRDDFWWIPPASCLCFSALSGFGASDTLTGCQSKLCEDGENARACVLFFSGYPFSGRLKGEPKGHTPFWWYLHFDTSPLADSSGMRFLASCEPFLQDINQPETE